MSLIPYHQGEGREIVLRHRNAVVVRDPESHRLEIRGSECPTCHQPLGGAPSSDRSYDRPYDMNHEFVKPDYFRMLRTDNHGFRGGNGPSSPVRRLVEPALGDDAEHRFSHSTNPSPAREDGNYFPPISDNPQTERSRIRREAFSPNYFKTFFVEEQVLGQGGKGVVLLVRHEIDGCALGHFACKRVPVGDDHSWLEKVLVEVELLAKLSHPNLVSYRHVWLEDMRLTRFGPSVACAFILQQYCNGGDLHQYVLGGAPREVTKEDLKARMRRRSKGQTDQQDAFNRRPHLTFEEIYSLFRDITSGVAYLHGANYIHRDLKPSNCLLHQENSKLTCLISDFGEVQAENVARKSTGSTGTISYCAPEVLKMDPSGCYGNFTTKSDIFSLGMILYFMCFGRLPYRWANTIHEELEDIDQLRAEITDWQGFQDERQERPDLPSKLYRLLKKLLALNPVERPSANEVLLAMRRETSFDNMTKDDWQTNASTPIRGSRIQSLDSPVPPASPVLGTRHDDQADAFPHGGGAGVAIDTPKNQQRVRRGKRTGEAAASSLRFSNDAEITERTASVQDIITRPDRSHANNFTTAQGSSRGGSPLPNEATSLVERSDGQLSPRLLMAPPRSRGGELWYQLASLTHAQGLTSRLNADTLDLLARAIIFMGKLVTLTQPCWPYVASLEVVLPLVFIAAAELGWPEFAASGRARSRHSRDIQRARDTRGLNLEARVLLLGLHFGTLWVARRWKMLCRGSSQDSWDTAHDKM